MMQTYTRANSRSTKRTSSFCARLIATFATVLCCWVTMTVFTACSSEENHPVTYKYEVKMVEFKRFSTDEANQLQAAFNSAVGTNGTVYTYHNDNQDSKMKSACDAVKKQFTNIQSVYLKFDLIRIASAVGGEDVSTVIATYEFGQALIKPYVYYAFVTNRDEAYAALEAKKATLDEETYNASLETLRKLVGIHTVTTLPTGETKLFHVSSVFETQYSNEFEKPWQDNEVSTQNLVTTCNHIADEHVNDVLAVDVIVTVTKTGFFDKKVTEMWRRTFPANVE